MKKMLLLVIFFLLLILNVKLIQKHSDVLTHPETLLSKRISSPNFIQKDLNGPFNFQITKTEKNSLFKDSVSFSIISYYEKIDLFNNLRLGLRALATACVLILPLVNLIRLK